VGTVAEHLATIEQQGYTIITDVFDPSRADALVAELDRLEVELAVTPATNDFEGRNTWRIYNLLAHGALFEAIPIDEAVLPVVDGVLDPGCLVSSLSSIAIGPGEQAQPIHADDQLLPLPKPHVPTVCNTMWALTDFTEANGATRVVAGSHRSDHSPDYGRHYDSVPAEMPKGSVLVWHGSLWHGGGANTTDDRRVGIAMNYCAGWIRQQENQQLGLAPSLVATFPPRLQQLVGYGVYNGLIGHVDRQSPTNLLASSPDGHDPILWDRLP
jgi:ectoine hydroxylase-related dioxygenase (phytanoyl-CoA dioxygenase family)